MAINREQKKAILEKSQDILDNAKSVVFVAFSKLGGNEAVDLRSSLAKEGVSYMVVKKTLLQKASESVNKEGEIPAFDGQTAIAYSFEDESAPARKIKDFAKKYEGKLSMLGGIFEGKFKNKEEIEEIANIPSLDVLRGMFVNIINSPIQRCAIVLDQIAQKKS